MTGNVSGTLSLFCGEEFSILDSQVSALSDCFESLVFVLGPFTLLAATSAFYVGRLRIPDINLKTPVAYSIRLMCTVVTLIFTTVNVFIAVFPQDRGNGYFTVSAGLVMIALLVHAIYLHRLLKVHFLRGHGPWPVIVSWLATLPHYIANAEFLISKAAASADKFFVIESAFAVVSCVSQIIYLLCLFVSNSRFRTISIDSPGDSSGDGGALVDSDGSSYLNIAAPSQGQSASQSSSDLNIAHLSPDQSASPADRANLFSKLFFGWAQPLMRKGADCALTGVESVYKLPKDITTEELDEKFLASLLRLQDGDPAYEKNLLLWTMHKSFGFVYYCCGILKLLADCLAFAGPLLLNRLVNFIENTDEPVRHGYYYAVGLFLSTLLGSLLSTHFDYQVSSRETMHTPCVIN